MTCYFVTSSKEKFQEVKGYIPQIEQLAIDLPEIQEIDAHKIISAKLHEAFQHHSGEFIVEDTSLYLDCLHGLPGPLVKWFLKTIGTHGLYEIADKLGNYHAVAKTIIGYAKGKDDIHFFDGTVEGTIVSPTGGNTFGWNDVFRPQGYTKTYAQMQEKELHSISMRRLATIKLKEFLDLRNG